MPPNPGDEYIRYLEEAGCESHVIAHCKAVRDVAVRIADLIIRNGQVPVNRELVAAGAILHDIGRSQTHGMDHADAGAVICRKKGYPEALCLIIERHIGAGLTREERTAFGLSNADRVPESIEEKIVAHADNLIKGTRTISRHDFDTSLMKFPDEVRARFTALADELESLAGNARFS